MKAYLANQQLLNLAEFLGEGGEGRVFALAEAEQQHAVKIYHQLPSLDKQAKLKAMVADNVAELGKVALWPTDLVYNEHQQIIGFVMPRLPVGSMAIHHLYNPSQRKLDFPQADYAFLVHVARNLAAAFAYLHSCGHCVGDVNQGNAVVAPDATITLIDCDSFQIEHQHRIFACEVGVAHFTPPELHGQPFGQITKTTTHDNFGLAILIFHLLMMGRHPFAGVYLGEGEMPIEKAITEFRYAYSRHAKNKQIVPPPNAPLMTWLPARIIELFEDAFGKSIDTRPTAMQWLEALEELEQQLISCDTNKAHKYYKNLASCPWCEFTSSHKVDFFVKDLSIHLQNKNKYASFKDSINKIKNQLQSVKINISNQLPEYLPEDFSEPEQRVISIVLLFSIFYVFLTITICTPIESLVITSFIGFIVRYLNLTDYLPKISVRKVSIPRSFWVMYIYLTMIFNFTDALFFSTIGWFLIKYVLIFIKFYKNINEPLDLWLSDFKYFQVKNDYWKKSKEVSNFRDKWSQHLLLGQQLVKSKEQALLWCNDYQYLMFSNTEDAEQRLEYLSSALPTLSQKISKDIEDYEFATQRIMSHWQRLNEEKIRLGLIYSYKNIVLLPLEPSENWTYKNSSIYNFLFMPFVIIVLMMNFSGFNKKELSIHTKSILKNESFNVLAPSDSNNKHLTLDKPNQYRESPTSLIPEKIYGQENTLHVISVYQGGYPTTVAQPSSHGNDSNSVIDVNVQYNPNASSVILLLASYESVSWNINVQQGVHINKIILSSCNNISKVTGINKIPVLIRNVGCPYKANEISELAEKVKTQIGAKAFTAQGGYYGSLFQTY